MKVQFLGAAKTVTGSCYMIEACGKRFCVDCGMHQGNKAIEQRNRDIKPYLPFTDSHPDARAGFADGVVDLALEVDFPPALLVKLPEHLRSGAVAMLAQNPTPHYQKDPARVYGIAFGGYDIRFRVSDGVAVVVDVVAQ